MPTGSMNIGVNFSGVCVNFVLNHNLCNLNCSRMNLSFFSQHKKRGVVFSLCLSQVASFLELMVQAVFSSGDFHLVA
jgi:hypothetical protein